ARRHARPGGGTHRPRRGRGVLARLRCQAKPDEAVARSRRPSLGQLLAIVTHSLEKLYCVKPSYRRKRVDRSGHACPASARVHPASAWAWPASVWARPTCCLEELHRPGVELFLDRTQDARAKHFTESCDVEP